MLNRFFISLILVILWPASLFSQGIAFKTLKVCEDVPEDILQSDAETIMNLKSLPTGLYLVRSITQSLEKSKSEKYYSYKKMLSKDNSKNLFCYMGTPNSSVKVQSFVPTVIDLTKEKKWGHAYWSIQVSADKKTGAIEANRSLIPGENYREKLKQQGFTIEERQKSHYEYELKLERSIASWKETIIVLYDQH